MKNDEWLTPPEILKPLGKFDLDPCSPEFHPFRPAAHLYTKEDDGLQMKWFGRVWLNPPFGSQATLWLEKLVQHGNGIALVAARTETKMFFDHVWPKASGVCFVRGRPHFHYVDGSRAAFNSGAPICLIAYGRMNLEVLRKSNLGKTISLQ